MPYSPFFPQFSDLPNALPIFPLEGAVVMPNADLPLNIFEPRYLNLVNDVLTSHRMFGMVQPDPSRGGSPTPVYRTGCAGRITSYQETLDGRIVLSLTGVCRFDIQEELPTTRGYRIVIPDWQRFAADMESADVDDGIGIQPYLDTLRRYFLRNNLDTDWDALEQLSQEQLVHGLLPLLPLAPAEKQVILEAVGLTEQANALVSALEFSLQEEGGPGPARH